MKGRLAGAQKGHGLLKKKADALQVRFRLILSKIIEVRKNYKFMSTKCIYFLLVTQFLILNNMII